MEKPKNLSHDESKAIARALYSTSIEALYFTKRGFEDIAIDVDPANTPDINTESRENYLNDIINHLPFDSAVLFIGKIISEFRARCYTEGPFIVEIEKRKSWHKKVDAAISRANKVLHPYDINIGQNGEVNSRVLKELEAAQTEVYDGLARWQLNDVRKLLENAEDYYHNGKSNNLKYDDCASNAAKALEGVLRKALVEANLAKNHPDPTPKLRAMMADAIKELDDLGFWSDNAIKSAANNYRKFLRNKSQHYNTETLDIKLIGFNRVTSFFALWEALTLIGTIIESMDEL